MFSLWNLLTEIEKEVIALLQMLLTPNFGGCDGEEFHLLPLMFFAKQLKSAKSCDRPTLQY